MTDISMKLSAYLDGELSDDEARIVEQQLADDPQLQAEFDELLAANVIAENSFKQMLHEPIALSVAQMIKTADASDVVTTGSNTESASGSDIIDREVPLGDAERDVINKDNVVPINNSGTRGAIWRSMAASLLVFLLGGAGGYSLHKELVVEGAGTNGIGSDVTGVGVKKAGWLQEIADYHAVYSTEERHLVEVGADKKEHLEKWLSKKTGALVQVPDLSGLGYVFEGGRLLVADGRPVAQLIYRDKDKTVVALCIQKMPPGMFKNKTKDQIVAADMNKDTIKDFDFVSWASGAVHYVVVGPNGKPELEKIAIAAARHI